MIITLSTTSADNIARLVDNIYNRPAATSPERFSFIQHKYLKTAIAIMASFFPPFEIAGFVHAEFCTTVLYYVSLTCASYWVLRY